MGYRGPIPKPTAFEILEGRPGHRPLNRNEPKPRGDAPKCPDHLHEKARKEWRRIVPILEALRLIALIDRAAIAAYCQSYGRWIEAEQKLAETSLVIKTKSGNVIENPYYSIAKRERELMHKFLIEFGMTPAARTRLNVQIPSTKPNQFAELSNRFGS